MSKTTAVVPAKPKRPQRVAKRAVGGLSGAPVPPIAWDLDVIIEWVLDGRSDGEICRALGITRSAWYDRLSRRPDASARIKEAKEKSAHAYAERALQVLVEAPATPVELVRAREIAQHYRWLSKVLLPRTYGDRQQVEAAVTLELGDALIKRINEA